MLTPHASEKVWGFADERTVTLSKDTMTTDRETEYHCTDVVRVSDSISSLKFSPNGHLLAIGTEDGTVAVIKIATLKCIRRLKEKAAVTAIEWHGSDSPTLLVGDSDGRVCLFQLEVRRIPTKSQDYF